ncbi:MAG: hypothetical protein E7413_00950 [Ruminococcaceae bacterium]|nr:hypothetical protein [Oscillospiraceae bacterium]
MTYSIGNVTGSHISPIEYNTIAYNSDYTINSIQEIVSELLRYQSVPPDVIGTNDDITNLFAYPTYVMGKWYDEQIIEIKCEDEEEEVITFDENVASELLDEIIGG